MTVTFAFVVLLVGLALVFDYINGFHDAANSIATVVSTRGLSPGPAVIWAGFFAFASSPPAPAASPRVLSPGQAVIWAAFFNFVAAFAFGTAVAKTVGSGMIDLK